MLDPDRQNALGRFLDQHGYGRAQRVALPGDASFRRYIRLVDGPRPAMVMDAPPVTGEDCTPFVAIADHLGSLGLSAPQVLAKDLAQGFLILEDLGDDLFARVLMHHPIDHDLYAAAIDVLSFLRHEPPGRMGDFALPAYDGPVLLREVALLCDWYLPLIHGDQWPEHLGLQWQQLWTDVFSQVMPERNILVLRDFHAENLFWLPGRAGLQKVGLIDFQDALLGDAAYDLVSLLEDARRDVPAPLAQAMTARYLDQTGLPPESFLRRFDILAAQRNAKIIGIFARLSERDGKSRYLNLIPRVMRLLRADVSRQPILTPIAEFLDRHVPDDAIDIAPTSRRTSA